MLLILIVYLNYLQFSFTMDVTIPALSSGINMIKTSDAYATLQWAIDARERLATCHVATIYKFNDFLVAWCSVQTLQSRCFQLALDVKRQLPISPVSPSWMFMHQSPHCVFIPYFSTFRSCRSLTTFWLCCSLLTFLHGCSVPLLWLHDVVYWHSGLTLELTDVLVLL